MSAEPVFDPLVDLAGLWTTDMADRYLPMPGLPARYECVDGRLVLTPTEAFSNSYGEHRLSALLQPAATIARLYVSGPVNLAFSPDAWIQPDLTVLHTKPRTAHENKWVPAELCTLVVEFVSPSSRGRDKIDKPAMCAAANIPYFMRVELVPEMGHASVILLKLQNGAYKALTMAIAGQGFETEEPFPMSFDPRDLLL